jgi:lysophospholipase
MSRARLVSLPVAPTPPNAEVTVVEAPDGLSLRVARWEAPADGPARGTVLLLHGFTEFIEKYYEVVEHLLSRGFGVVTYDHRGQGLSERLLPRSQRGHQTDFADLVAEAVYVHEQMLGEELPRPHLLMAHSMGGNVALRVLQEYPRRFDRAVLSAPMTGFDRIPAWLMNVIATLFVMLGRGGSYAWGAGDEDLENPQNRVTSDASRFARALAFWRHEPALVTSGVTWRWVREATRSMARVARPERMAQIETPTLLASAGRDQVVSSASHRVLSGRSPKLRLVHLSESMHEILQEADAVQAEFWAHFDEFVGSQDEDRVA